MASNNTCAGADTSLPREILEQIRLIVKAKRDNGTLPWNDRPHAPNKKPRTHLDYEDACLFEDLGYPCCQKGLCKFPDLQGKTKDNHDPKYKLD